MAAEVNCPCLVHGFTTTAPTDLNRITAISDSGPEAPIGDTHNKEQRVTPCPCISNEKAVTVLDLKRAGTTAVAHQDAGYGCIVSTCHSTAHEGNERDVASEGNTTTPISAS